MVLCGSYLWRSDQSSCILNYQECVKVKVEHEQLFLVEME